MRWRWPVICSLALALSLATFADAAKIVQPSSGPPRPFFYEAYGQSQPAGNIAFPSGTTNGNSITFITPVTISHICYLVQTADAVGLYDVGIYNSAGTLVADTGPIHMASGFVCSPTVQTSATLSGTMTVAITGNAVTAHLFDSNNGLCGSVTTGFTGGATAGGQLNASGLTIPAINPSQGPCYPIGGY